MLFDVGLGGHALLDEIEAVENVLAFLSLCRQHPVRLPESVY